MVLFIILTLFGLMIIGTPISFSRSSPKRAVKSILVEGVDPQVNPDERAWIRSCRSICLPLVRVAAVGDSTQAG